MSTNGDSVAAVVLQACGVIKQRHGITIEQAYTALRAAADVLGRDVVELATDVVRSTTSTEEP